MTEGDIRDGSADTAEPVNIFAVLLLYAPFNSTEVDLVSGLVFSEDQTHILRRSRSLFQDHGTAQDREILGDPLVVLAKKNFQGFLFIIFEIFDFMIGDHILCV